MQVDGGDALGVETEAPAADSMKLAREEPVCLGLRLWISFRSFGAYDKYHPVVGYSDYT